MFFDPRQIAQIAALEASWLCIRAELDAANPGAFQPWKERHIYDRDWDTLFLFDGYKDATPKRIAQNCAAFPQTERLLSLIPGLLTAGFSRLGPGTIIVPHRGFDPHVLRIHLGLHVPENCWLTVRGQRRSWEEGKILAFDDTYLHEVKNQGLGTRTILLVDIKLTDRPSRIFPDISKNMTLYERGYHLAMCLNYYVTKAIRALS